MAKSEKKKDKEDFSTFKEDFSKFKEELLAYLFLFGIILLIFFSVLFFNYVYSTNENEIDNRTLNYSNIFYSNKSYDSNLLIKNIEDNQKFIVSFNNTETMILYTNGTIWIKNNTEQQNGEQLAKLSIAYSSYINGYCDSYKKEFGE